MNHLIEKLNTIFSQIRVLLLKIKKLNLSAFRKVFSLMDWKEKIALILLLFTLLFSIFWICGNWYIQKTVLAPKNGGSYSESILGEPLHINPLLATEDADLALCKLIFSSLYTYNQAGALVPDLAEDMPEISEDQKNYTIKIRQNAKWHNGVKLTADDVIFTFNLIKDQAYKLPSRFDWQATNINKIDDYTVRFTTKDISGPFVQNLTMGILPKHLWENIEPRLFGLSELNFKAIGSGPFMLKQIKKESGGKIVEVKLSAFGSHYRKKPYLDEIVFKFFPNSNEQFAAFKSGETEGAILYPAQLEAFQKKNNQTLNNIKETRYQTLVFNLNNKFLADINTRKALTLPIDREKIVSQIYGFQAQVPLSPISRTNKNNSDTDTETREKLAREIFDKIGYKTNPENGFLAKQGQILEIELASNDNALNTKTAELLAESWRKLGIKINIKVLGLRQLSEEKLKNHAFDILLIQQNFGADPDPFAFFHSSQINYPGKNLSSLNDPLIDKLITEGRSTTNQEKRMETYLALDNALSEKMPVYFIAQLNQSLLLPQKIKTVLPEILYDSSQRFANISDWYIYTKRIWKQ